MNSEQPGGSSNAREEINELLDRCRSMERELAEIQKRLKAVQHLVEKLANNPTRPPARPAPSNPLL